MYRAAAAVCFVALLTSVAAGADRQDQEDAQREMNVAPVEHGNANPSSTGALKEQSPGKRPSAGVHSLRNANKAQSNDVLPSWVHWPSLTDF